MPQRPRRKKLTVYVFRGHIVGVVEPLMTGPTLPLLPPNLSSLKAQSEKALMRDVEKYLPHNIEKEFYDVPDFVARGRAIADDISLSSLGSSRSRSRSASLSASRSPSPRPKRRALELKFV